MAHEQVRCARIALFGCVLLGWFWIPISRAGDHLWRRRAQETVVVRRARPAYTSGRPLGTFQPTPYVMVRGNDPLGGGYSPLGISGDQTMTLYGPLSLLRARTAPVLGYVRGYDGRLWLTEGTSSSTPNLPELSPVIYPTEANNYYGPRESRTPPWWSNAVNWIDQH
jgi:hypothetical protein